MDSLATTLAKYEDFSLHKFTQGKIDSMVILPITSENILNASEQIKSTGKIGKKLHNQINVGITTILKNINLNEKDNKYNHSGGSVNLSLNELLELSEIISNDLSDAMETS